MLCVSCVLQVSRAFTFKQQCRRSDETLRTFYLNIEDEIITTTNVDGIPSGDPVEVEFHDPTNGENCVFIVQPFTTMQNSETLTIEDENDLIGSVICGEDLDTVVENIISEDEHEQTDTVGLTVDQHMNLVSVNDDDLTIVSNLPLDHSNIQEHLETNGIHMHLDQTDIIQEHLESSSIQDHFETDNIQDHMLTDNFGKFCNLS